MPQWTSRVLQALLAVPVFSYTSCCACPARVRPSGLQTARKHIAKQVPAKRRELRQADSQSQRIVN